MSGYQLAIEATTHAIRARAQRYRNLAVAVVVVLIGSVGATLIVWSWRPLLGLGVIAVLYAAFLIGDTRVVLGWQRLMLDLWADGQLEFLPLRDALRAVPTMPVRTLDGMIALLPLGGALRVGEPPELRRAVAFVIHECHVVRHIRSLSIGAARLAAAASVGGALASWSALPMLGLSAILLLWIAGRAHQGIVMRRWQRALGALSLAGADGVQLRRRLASSGCADPAFVQRLAMIVKREE